MTYLSIFVSTIFINNLVLTRFLGLCPFIGTSNKIENAIGMSIATTFVLTISSTLSFVINKYFIIPFGLNYLYYFFLIFIIAASVQICEILIKNIFPILYKIMGMFLPLITSNCAILGVALFVSPNVSTIFKATFYGFSSGIGFGLVLVCFSAVVEKIQYSPVPKSFKGVPIALITVSLISLAFYSFSSIKL